MGIEKKRKKLNEKAKSLSCCAWTVPVLNIYDLRAYERESAVVLVYRKAISDPPFLAASYIVIHTDKRGS